MATSVLPSSQKMNNMNSKYLNAYNKRQFNIVRPNSQVSMWRHRSMCSNYKIKLDRFNSTLSDKITLMKSQNKENNLSLSPRKLETSSKTWSNLATKVDFNKAMKLLSSMRYKRKTVHSHDQPAPGRSRINDVEGHKIAPALRRSSEQVVVNILRTNDSMSKTIESNFKTTAAAVPTQTLLKEYRESKFK